MKRLIIAVISMLLMAGSAVAADDMEKDYSKKGYDQKNQQSYKQMEQTRQKNIKRGQKANLINIESFENREVIDANGEEVGEIEGALLNARSGKLEFIVLNVGGIWGLGEDRVVVPYRAVNFKPDSDDLYVDKSLSEMSEAPEYNEEDLFEDEEYRESVYKHYGYEYEKEAEMRD